ncbi:hypothetical protein ACFWIY_23670 [Streptomyces sioyaensis]|uniref:hypothetical protein n=1 Tax=Streptomyces sioyaensis TaxID=67364 RepID=UPI0036581363
MDLKTELSAQPGATPIDGLPDAWHWSRAVFNFDAILTHEREYVLQLNVMGRYDEQLAHAILTFAHKHSAALADGARPLIPVGGFDHPGWDFDTVVAVRPAVHDYHSQNPELHSATFAIFPGYQSEFSGNETEEETWQRFRKMLQPTKLDRECAPFVKMRYANTRTQSDSNSPERVLAPLSRLLRELPLLKDAPGSFVQWENRLGEVWNAEWVTDLTLSGPAQQQVTDIDALAAFAERSVTGTDGTA